MNDLDYIKKLPLAYLKYLPRITGHALVLGGSGGIGSEIVPALVAYGASAVSVAYGRNKAAAEALQKELRAARVTCYIGAVDPLDEKSFSAFLDDAVRAVGEEISVAVNSIGFSPNTPLEEQTLEERRKVFDVNVHGTALTSRLILARMKEKGIGAKGSLVLITSSNGINSQASYSSHYDESKAALIPMIKNLAEIYAPIRVNGVAPGWVETAMNDTLPPGEREKETAKIFLNRYADPAEVASFVAFISSSGGTFINNENYKIDGGTR